MSSNKKINTAVLGYGLSGKVFHVPFLLNSTDFNLHTILSSQSTLQSKFPDTNIETELDKVLSHPDIELIINSLPNDMHHSITKKALELGKHVIVEKPFANTSEEAQDLVNTAKEFGRVLSVYHNRRYDGDFLDIKKRLASHEFGELKIFESRFDRFSPEQKGNWREKAGAGNGVYFDLAPHLIDQTCELFGKPQRIFAQLFKQRPNAEVDDAFEIMFFYEDRPELQVKLGANCFTPQPKTRFKISGSLGGMETHEFDPQEALLKDEILPSDSSWKQKNIIEDVYLYMKEYQLNPRKLSISGGHYGDYYRQLADCILRKKPLEVEAEAGVYSLELLEAGLKSYESGRVIEISN